ncbi:MAG: restriction endonuclease [Halobacteriales archaeon]
MSNGEEYVPATRQLVREHLQRMDPDEFEHFVADLWERFGWQTRVVGEPGDQVIDVVAHTADGERQLIQAKRYGPTTTVGSPEVQQYASLRIQTEGPVNQVTIVTTGEFSDQAEAMASDLDVILVDGGELIGLVEEVEAVELIAEYFDDIELRADVETANSEPADSDGVLSRVRSWFG